MKTTTTTAIEEQVFEMHIPSRVSEGSDKWMLELSQGAKSMMYTVWKTPDYTNPAVSPYAKPQYIQNLSIDKAEAWKKAVEISERMGLVLYDEAVDELRKIADVTKGELNFGKHEGKHVSELEDGYLLWVANGACFEGDQGWVYCAQTITVEFAKQEAIKRGLLIEFEGKFISQKFINAILKSREGWGHHAAAGAKLALNVEVIKMTRFDGMYGTTYINTFKTFDGKKYQYMGSARMNIEVGEFHQITGTVKLDEYKGEKITKLQRVKILTLTERVY